MEGHRESMDTRLVEARAGPRAEARVLMEEGPGAQVEAREAVARAGARAGAWGTAEVAEMVQERGAEG